MTRGVLAWTLVLCAGAARAQTFRLQPSLDVESVYDSAVGFLEAGDGLAALSPELVLHVRPGFRASVPARWVDLDAAVDLDWVQYSGLLTPGSDVLSHLEGAGEVDLALNKSGAVEVALGNTFTRGTAPPDGLFGLGVLALRDEQHVRVPIHPGSGAVEVTPSVGITVEQYEPLLLATGFSETTLLQASDSTTFSGGLAAAWRISPRASVSFDSAFESRSYQADPHASDILRTEVGGTFLFTPRLSLGLSAGWAEDFLEHGNTAVGHLEVSYRLGEAGAVSLGYARSLGAVPLYGTYVEDRLYLQALRRKGRLTVRALASIAELSMTGRTDEIARIEAGPAWSFLPWLSGSFDYDLDLRSSSSDTAESVNFLRHVLTLRLTLSY